MRDSGGLGKVLWVELGGGRAMAGYPYSIITCLSFTYRQRQLSRIRNSFRIFASARYGD